MGWMKVKNVPKVTQSLSKRTELGAQVCLIPQFSLHPLAIHSENLQLGERDHSGERPPAQDHSP